MEMKFTCEIKGGTAQIANVVIETIAFNLKYLIWVRKRESRISMERRCVNEKNDRINEC